MLSRRTFRPLGFSLSVLFCQALAPAPAMAQGPLSIEQLIVSNSIWQLSSGTRFSSRQLEGGLHEELRDAQLGLRYGLRPNIELNAQLRHSQSILRAANTARVVESSALDLGFTWQILAESVMPAFLLEYRLTTADSRGDFATVVAAHDVALTAYKSIDPVVLSMTFRHRNNNDYKQGNRAITPGDLFQLEALVNFAVNPEVTLLGGAIVERRDALLVDKTRRQPRHDRVAMRAGIGIAGGLKHTLFALGDIASDGSAAVSFSWLYRF